MSKNLKENRTRRKNEQEQVDHEIENELNRYSVKLIKSIGVVGAVMGIIIIGFFWYWIIRKMF